MAKIFHTVGEPEERGYDQRMGSYGYHQRGHEEDHMLEKAFKEGCEHGYQKAMKEFKGYDERGGRIHFREAFEEKIEKLKEKYR